MRCPLKCPCHCEGTLSCQGMSLHRSDLWPRTALGAVTSATRCALTGILLVLSVISLPSSFWCPQVLQFPLLSLSNSAHVRTLINQCQVTECTTRAVFFHCPLSPHTSHCSKKLIQMARKQPMQHIKEMRQK